MTETIAGRRRLGRGLEALLGPTREEAEREGSLVELAIADIRPNPYQPRRDVDPAALDELQASIRKAGLLQPVVVRPVPGGNGGFELIAGERRMRACQALGWEKIPAVKREGDDRTVLTLALIEDALRRRLGTDVRVTLRAKGKGQIHLNFYSNDDLARLLELILGAPFDG